MSGFGPIHPALAPLAREAKAYADAMWTTGSAPDRLLAALRDATTRVAALHEQSVGDVDLGGLGGLLGGAG